jgi:hypothetical protein
MKVSIAAVSDSDSMTIRIRKVTAGTGIISTVAGAGGCSGEVRASTSVWESSAGRPF